MASPTTLLAQVCALVTVDVDSMDPDVAARYSTPNKFCDMTSNQAIVHGQAVRPERRELLEAAVDYVRKYTNSDGEAFEQDVVDVLTVLLAKQVYPHLTGNVHAQTSPSSAYDTQKTIEHAQKLVALFSAHGIPQNRVCIKIPATPESLLACRTLQDGGVQTLATCLFSLPQAVAASQAGCVYVAPYFNELRVHFQPGLWKEYADTKTDHPMSPVILTIVRRLKSWVEDAGYARQVIALVSLSPNHLTLSGAVLDALAGLPSLAPEAFGARLYLPPRRIDYLANGGALLAEALAGDAEVQRKLADALAIFGEKEKETRQLVRDFVLA
ncbi:aldolase [Mycena sp. CBHHK59/15]|nr:aldolase [Mycena sp. CBHHK59/15]